MTGRWIGFSDDASVNTSSSGRSASGGGGRDLGGANVPRHILLKRRVLSMTQYANEQRRGGNASLSVEDRRRLYGGSVIPVAVPLLPGESVDEHEAKFQSWLDQRGYTLASLREQTNKERSLRTSFAMHKLQAWKRNGQREPSMTISFANTGKRARSSDGEEELDDDETYAPASSKRVCRDTTNRNADELLRTHVLSVSEYRDKVERGVKLCNSMRTQPIAVPLFPGETVDEYERRFQAFLSTVSMDLNRLADEPNTERSVRLLFARKRLTGGPPPPLDSGKARIVQATHTPSILSRVSDVKTPSALDEAESVDTERIVEPVVIEPSQDPVDPKLRFPSHCSFRPPPTGPNETSIPKAYLACGCRKCLLRCTSRLVRQVAELQRELVASKSSSTTLAAAAAARTSDTTARVVDFTQASETAPPPAQASSTSAPQARRFDVAKMLQITSLIKSRRQTHASSSTSTSNSSRLTPSGDSDDPIALQLCSQYDEINERVVENERVLENASLELQGTQLAQSEQLQQASMTQDENLELRACIEEEKDRRDAALAMLIVYMWRHAPQQLQQRIDNPSASDVVHVTCACHHKSASLASELSRHRSQASSLKQRLDAVLSGSLVETGDGSVTLDDEDEESQRLAQLQRLGEELTSVEEAMRTIHKTRQRELMTLLHFDSQVRRLVAVLLTEKQDESSQTYSVSS